MSKKIKWYLIGFLIALVAIVFIQNTETVETRILFFTIAMPRVILLIGLTLIGFATGYATAFAKKKRSDY